MPSPKTIQANFNYPSQYRLGAGRRSELSSLCFERGIRRPLVVSDHGVAALPWFSALVASLEGAGLSVTVFSNVRSNPIGSEVEEGVQAYHSGDCNGIILVGGGSALDVGKCIALMAEHPGSLFDFEDVGDNWTKVNAEKIPPMIALPSTAGTGSEVGRASVIINEIGEKKIIFHPSMQPGDVIADPEITCGLPPHLTAYTGVDAFVHCFEAWCAPGYHPMADGIALEGMRLIAAYLPRAFQDGNDIEARTHMIMASSMGATAFQKGLGVVHAISHALGAKLNLHHGLANAILLPYCMVFNRPKVEERCKRIALYLALPQPGFDALLSWVLELRSDLQIPHTLSAVEGMNDAAALTLAPLAKKDAALGGNPQEASEADLAQIMRNALSGNLG